MNALLRISSVVIAATAVLATQACSRASGATGEVPFVLEEPTSEGSFRVLPREGVAGEFGTWTVTYTVGPHGIRTGGGIRVQLPDVWHSGPRNSANRLQATDPSDEHYVSARSTRDDVELQTRVEEETGRRLVKHVKRGLDGRKGRYVFVVRVRIVEGNLREGDRIEVVYGDRSRGSPGYRAAAVSTAAQPIRIAVDSSGTERFRLHTQSKVTLTSLPGRPVEMMLHLPTEGVVGQPLTGTVAIVDKESNPVDIGASVDMTIHSGNATVPTSVTLPPGPGYVQFRVIPRATGIIRLRAEARALGLTARSNPLQSLTEAPRLKVYWGDIHSHSVDSFDGVGDRPFDYARYVSGLDFYALTDHTWVPDADGTTTGLTEATWGKYVAAAERHHEPGRFVTLHAYEISFGTPYGHHNVYFRGQPGPLLYPQTSTLPEVWKKLRAGEALTIPHHTGKFPEGIVFSPQDDRFRRNFEIYSGHGLSEAYDPHHPLAFEKSDFTSDSKSRRQPSYAQDAWMSGVPLSTIASSDDHHSHPGKPHWGAVAVRAAELTREGVFDALFHRRTYATTGSRILLEFSLDAAPMGSHVAVSDAPNLEIRAIGTDAIATVELLRHVPGEKQFTVRKRWQPQAAEFSAGFIDEGWREGAIYYVRLAQENLVRGRAVMAWSTPIWTIRPEEAREK